MHDVAANAYHKHDVLTIQLMFILYLMHYCSIPYCFGILVHCILLRLIAMQEWKWIVLLCPTTFRF